jgi:hypothetical protein
VQQAGRGILPLQPLEQPCAKDALARTEGLGIPFRAVAVVDGDEGRLAAHGEAHLLRGKVGVDAPAQLVDRRPLRLAVGPRDARRFAHALDAHVVRELDLALVGEPADRGRAAGLRAARQRHVPFAGKQARGGIEPDPARAGQIGFAPGMQVREVARCARGAIERLHIRRQLDQVARDEARRDAEMAQQLHQQPSRVAARAAAERQRLLRGLHPRLHADDIAHILGELAVQLDEEIHGPPGLARNLVEVGLEEGRGGHAHEVGRELARQVRGVAEWVALGVGLEEEIERIDDRHLGDQVHLDAQLARLLGEHQASEPVALRVLLPVHEVLLRRDAQRVGMYRRARMRRGPEAHHLRPELHRPVVAIVRDVVQRDVDRH